MHTIAPALPAVDDAAARQVVLRDGSVAGVRVSTHADVAALRTFFRDLSAESRYRRFFSAGDPTDALIERLSDSTNPTQSLTLIAHRSVDGELRIVATASYIALKADEAEVAFAVADQFQGKGLGTALLERLAV
ncbi:MAG TPA: GNAT family N-acetyltransferase [Gemmataceae bacterium]|nr:GNAT family N-acetyltransferase [Gemmataceae bacterium]